MSTSNYYVCVRHSCNKCPVSLIGASASIDVLERELEKRFPECAKVRCYDPKDVEFEHAAIRLHDKDIFLITQFELPAEYKKKYSGDFWQDACTKCQVSFSILDVTTYHDSDYFDAMECMGMIGVW